MEWQDFEKSVITAADIRFSSKFSAKTIAEVKCDAFCQLSADTAIAIEITTNTTIEKIREDCTKLDTIRTALNKTNILTRSYIICNFEPTAAMKGTGDNFGVTVQSLFVFCLEVFDFQRYFRIRSENTFGSFSSKKTSFSAQYVPVTYLCDYKNKSLSDIQNSISQGMRVVLLGEFGTGKSRALSELFNRFSCQNISNFNPCLAIDLRQSWGLVTAEEVLQRHLRTYECIGQLEGVLRLARAGKVNFLIDGFDEISSQGWTNDPKALQKIRFNAVEPVRDLIRKYNDCGFFITGRSHYFNSDAEMLAALGLKKELSSVFYTKDEFTEEEINNYIKSAGLDIAISSWMPKKPLVAEILIDLNPSEIDEMSNFNSEVLFLNSS